MSDHLDTEYNRYDDPGDLLKADPGSSGYADEHDRIANTSDVSKSIAEVHRSRLRGLVDANRSRSMDVLNREMAHGIRAYAHAVDKNLRQVVVRESGLRAKANIGGAAYNIITMQYNPTPEGTRLKRHDQLLQYRSDVRSTVLAAKSHAGFSPITGQQVLTLDFPKFPPLN